jgi:leader peptidase (prepilin peptidase)/N-methyltransferase
MESWLALLFGLLIGSFLNVCIYRWPRDLSVVKPRSHCTSCEKVIAWYDNVPLVSYLVLRGRCRHCGTHIPVRYPLVELLTGALFFYIVHVYGPTAMALKLCVFSATLLALLFTDLEERILPDEFTLGGTLVGLLFALVVPIPDMAGEALLWMAGSDAHGRWVAVFQSALGAALPALVLWSAGWFYQKIRHREGLGFGDVKLVALIGSFLGLEGALLTLVLGSIAGSVLGLAYIKITRKDPNNYELPFGSFLSAAALAAAVFGDRLLGWYARL